MAAAGALSLVAAAVAVRFSPWARENALKAASIRQLEAEVRQGPNDALALYYLGHDYYLAGRFADARQVYARAVELDPRSSRARLGYGLTLFQVGALPEAETELSEAARLNPRDGLASYELGNIAWRSGQTAAAVPLLQRAVRLSPSNSAAWYGLGVCLIQVNRRQDAVSCMEQAVRHAPADPQYHASLGELYAYFNRLADARAQYRQALALDPHFGPACALMGRLILDSARDSAQLGRAQDYLLEAVALPQFRPQDAERDLGDDYLRLRDYPHAAIWLQRSIRRDPEDARAYYLLMQVYRRQGDAKRAAAEEQAFHSLSSLQLRKDHEEVFLSTHPDQASAHLELARIYRQLRMLPQAADQYEAYHRLLPADRSPYAEYAAVRAMLLRERGQSGDFAPALNN